MEVKRAIKCLVVDDEPLALGLLEEYIEQFAQLELVASCWNAIEAFEIVKTRTIDLIFLDIQMPGLSGIQFVRSLKNPPAIIFTTAYRDYAVESYELDVIDYLLKPITMDRFLKSINKYFDLNATNTSNQKQIKGKLEPSYLYVSANRKFVKIIFEDILYIESIKDYVSIYTKDENIQTKDKISVFELKLPDYFIRIHRSYIVNSKKVTSYTMKDVEIGRLEIPIGISYKKQVLSFLNME